MMMIAGIAAVALATCLGYYAGLRAGSTPSTWKKRTSRIALGRLAISLLVVLTARRLRHLWASRLIAPVELLRGSVARMLS
jgi:hypothetical protein